MHDSKDRRRSRPGAVTLIAALAAASMSGGAASASASGSPSQTAGARGVEAAGRTQAPAEGAAGERAEALDWAFRFASAIQSDPKDMARAQENVVDDLAEAGRLDEALRRAELIAGWRRGAALADLAARMITQGRAAEGRALLERVQQIRGTTEGWEGPRVEAHVAQALATMGETGKVAEIGGRLASDDRQYVGRSAATLATGLARTGDFQGAMKTLAPLDTNDDIDVAWWRTAGYLAIAKQERLPAEDRRTALDAAKRSAERVSDWRKTDSLQSVAEEYKRMGLVKGARACLASAETALKSLPETMAVRSPLMSNLARSWARIGGKERAKELLKGAGEHVEEAMLTERPAIWANLASTYSAIGDDAAAWKTFDRALDGAAALENARPRALAVVSICRAIGRAGLALPQAMQGRLASLLEGLKDPW